MILKTLKENDTKVTKDVLLHKIFQEISDEDNDNSDDIHIDKTVPAPKTKLSKIREMQKKRQWIVIVLLVISILYLLFNTTTESTQNEKDQTDIYTIPRANQIVKQKKETVLLDVLKEEAKNDIIIEETNPIQIIQEDPLEEKEVYTEDQTVMKVKDPQTAREKAKESLFMQMQN